MVDNGSRDESRPRLREHPEIHSVMLPGNLSHELALDIGVLLCATEYVVTMDVDAFPLHDRWLEELLAPLDAGAEVSGARLNRDYVHPCCWAMRTARFVEQGHSFRSRYRPREEGRDASGDVGEDISSVRRPVCISSRSPANAARVTSALCSETSSTTTFTRRASARPPRARSTAWWAKATPRPHGKRPCGGMSDDGRVTRGRIASPAPASRWAGPRRARGARARRPSPATGTSPCGRETGSLDAIADLLGTRDEAAVGRPDLHPRQPDATQNGRYLLGTVALAHLVPPCGGAPRQHRYPFDVRDVDRRERRRARGPRPSSTAPARHPVSR